MLTLDAAMLSERKLVNKVKEVKQRKESPNNRTLVATRRRRLTMF